MMLASIDMAHYQFSSHRMLREYYDVMYAKTLDCKEKNVCPSYFDQPYPKYPDHQHYQ
jgi:hypothetical protein